MIETYEQYIRPALEARLAWCHGPERARAILEGRDEKANRDLESWNRATRNGGRVVSFR